MLPEALVFDVDGTLAETEEWHRLAFNEAFKAAGLSWEWDNDLYRDLLQVTGGKERLAHYILVYKPPGGTDMLTKIATLHADKTQRYNAFVEAGHVQPKPGVVRLMREAHEKGVPIAVATMTMLSNVEALLKVMFGDDAEGLVSVIASGDVVTRKKPAPDIYLYACDKLALPPCKCVAFEDSENGAKAAHAAGLTVIATPSLYLWDDDFSVAASVLSDLGEPDKPFKPLGGVPVGEGYVTVDALQDLLNGDVPRDDS